MQELHLAVNACVNGLPAYINVYVTEVGHKKAAEVINDGGMESMCARERTNECGVCVWIKGDFGEMYVVSAYCMYGQDLEQYLAYLECVRERIREKITLVGMNSNAVSPLWFSKSALHSRDNVLRGEMLEDG